HTLEPPILVTAGLLFPSASDDHCRNFCTILGVRDSTPTQPALFVQPVLLRCPGFLSFILPSPDPIRDDSHPLKHDVKTIKEQCSA
ncbi:hypothetical protein J4Z16_24375, partial [Escherichia coli]